MFNPRAYENSRPDGVSILEIVDGSDKPEGRPRRFVPLKRTELKGEVAGPLAALRLVQTYGFTAEQCDKVVEALYRFPLPGDAALTAVRVRFGDVEIRAELKERAQAEAEYQEAKRQAKQAAIVTRESPDVFTLQVAGIQPGQDVTVETAYVQLARPEGAGWSLRIPLTTSPRYVRSDERTSPHAQGQPLALLRDPGHRFRLDLVLPAAAEAASPTHRLDVRREGERLRVRLHDGEVIPDRDCVLTWKLARQQDRPTVQVLLHDDHAAGQVYFLALVAPPATHDRGRGVPREVVLLVDHSGSMQGAKWQAADWAVERFLADLTERDAAALGLFHDKTRWFAKAPRPASPTAVRQWVDFLKANRDNGGTELGVALEQALHLERSKDERARHVLVITDAEVSDAGRILRLADEEAKRPDRRRISVLCIDASPNALLATELAEAGGGVARFLTSDPQEEDITTALDEVLADWAEPVLSGLRLEVNRAGAEAAGREAAAADEAGWSRIDLGDLPAGRAVWVAGRVPRGDGDLAFRVRAGTKFDVASCRMDMQHEADARPALLALFGARRVRGLEYLMNAGYTGAEFEDQLRRLGYDPAQALAGRQGGKVYAENTRADAVTALKQLLVSESLRYGLACAETAFVAVRTEAGQPVEESVIVANALPAGWSGAFLGGAGAMSGTVLCSLRLSAGAPAAAPPVPSSLYGGSGSARSARHAGSLKRRLVSGGRTWSKDAATPPPAAPQTVLFSGVPAFANGEAVLFDAGAGGLADGATITALSLRFPDGTPDAAQLDPGLCVLLFVEDLAAPRARVRLADLVRQGGSRPVNLRREAGQLVRVVLADPAGAWVQHAPRLEVALAW